MWELNSLFGLYLYTGGYKNDFYVSLRQSSVYLMRRGLKACSFLSYICFPLRKSAFVCVSIKI